MPAFLRASGPARVVALALLFSFVVAPSASAKSGTKKKAVRSAEPAAAAVLAAHPAPIRFFTINQVLAKQDALKRGAGPVRLAAVDPPGTATDADPAAEQPARGPEPFGLFPFRAPEGPVWAKWRIIEAQIRKENEVLAGCRENPEDCPASAIRFRALLAAAHEHAGRARLDEVNRQVNGALRYVSDLAQHGEADRWSSPFASLSAGRGDCEDFAILKYAILREAGVAAGELRIVLLRDASSRQDHAVLAARQDGRWLVLDNLRSATLDAAALTHYVPLFAVGHDGVNLLAAPYAVFDRGGEGIEVMPATAEWSIDVAPADASASSGRDEAMPLL